MYTLNEVQRKTHLELRCVSIGRDWDEDLHIVRCGAPLKLTFSLKENSKETHYNKITLPECIQHCQVSRNAGVCVRSLQSCCTNTDPLCTARRLR